MALGANQHTKGEHEQIYRVHHDYLADITRLPFPACRAIDTAVTEHLDSGLQVTRTPRQWAKSLTFADGTTSLEADLENGTSDGTAVLIVPSASVMRATQAIQSYWQRKNPTLTTAERFYSASVLADPDIPLTVFTCNIDKILSKQITRPPASVTDPPVSVTDDSTAQTGVTPASSITAATSLRSKSSAGIAWNVPLQETLTDSATKSKRPSSREILRKKRDDILRAQHGSASGIAPPSPSDVAKTTTTSKQRSKTQQSTGSSRQSISQYSAQSHLTTEAAHERIDTLEGALLEIKELLQMMHTSQTATQRSSTAAPAADSQSNNQLALIPPADSTSMTSPPATPQRKAPKRRNTAATPPDLNSQYNDPMSSGGEESF